ncbi:hypothetical protein SAMN05216359_11530 [Roseateles sp. YR242]|uniref:exonuclease n=1 Tax=Roseateles sp. YR242 TaxID=1855305 RepID=UPI0008BF24F0|nr:exonuclease [Roseateles sp. YR242]SEL73200.1 hypothetical protein SAMN05216359_11530 [Roseateles sp. YR242]
MNEIYLSTDIETDGPIPGPHSMLSFASAAYTADKQLVATFSANLETLPGASAHPETAAWWATQPEAWAACLTHLETPESAMRRYVDWITTLPGKPVFVGYQAGFDLLFVYWYLIRFTGKSPFSFSALDIKSYGMAVLGTDFRATTKRQMPKHWFDALPHTHVALDDPIEQGAMFCNILQDTPARTGRKNGSGAGATASRDNDRED